MSAQPHASPPSRDYGSVDVLSRADFLDCFAQDYARGQHVTLLGPTQRGKTTLCHQMLAEVINPQFKALVLATKPPRRDPVMARAAQRLNLRIVNEWPPEWKFGDRNKNGYVVRPMHDMRNLRATNANLTAHIGAAMRDGYATKPEKPVIIVADEAHIIQNDLGLKDEMEAPLMRGAPDCALWSLIQRGRNMTYHCYAAPEWILLAYDPDKANTDRYSEIGGVDPRFLSMLLRGLKTYTGADGRSTVSEFVCIRRRGPEVFIVDVT